MRNPKSVSQFRWAGVRAAVLGLAMVSAAAWMSGCSPLVVSGAMVGGTLVALDRRTSGAQVEDEAIEFKGTLRVREIAGSGAKASRREHWPHRPRRRSSANGCARQLLRNLCGGAPPCGHPSAWLPMR